MNVSLALSPGDETPTVRIVGGVGGRFLSLALGQSFSVCLSSYDGKAADYARALADELYAAADALEPVEPFTAVPMPVGE